MQILKLITAGSVDDGKSTLIGRLLYDTDSVLTDQMEALHAANRKNDDGNMDLAILTDGLKAEREQGITIDVAYKYFQTANRKFIFADTPGHIQYTRNMVTGASNADLAIILIDARKGIIEQTVRHSYLISLVGIAQVIVCVNKMDLVDYNEDAYNAIVTDYRQLAAKVKLKQVYFIPVSALKGDNIVRVSQNMTWYTAESLLAYLENINIQASGDQQLAILPIQFVIRPQTDELHDNRGYAGRISSGLFKINDPVKVLPSGFISTLSKIELLGQELHEASAGMSVIVQLKDAIDIGRGDVLVGTGSEPQKASLIEADICWMDLKSMDTSRVYLIQHNSKTTRCRIQKIKYKVNINTLEKQNNEEFKLNDIGRVVVKTAEPIIFDFYQYNKTNGGAILIDGFSNLTVGVLFLRAEIKE